MGVLTEGIPIKWDDSTPEIRDYVKKHGILQFISNFKNNNMREDEELIWGDEVGTKMELDWRINERSIRSCVRISSMERVGNHGQWVVKVDSLEEI